MKLIGCRGVGNIYINILQNSFLITRQKHMLWYSLEAPWRGASNEYPQHMFSSRKKKNIGTFWWKKSALSRAMVAIIINYAKVITNNQRQGRIQDDF